MKELLIIQHEIIGARETESIEARDLWNTLEIKQRFADWIKTQISSLGLEENIDYIRYHINVKTESSGLSDGFLNKNNRQIDYKLTLDAAEHIAMASRTENGKQIRNFFIQTKRKLDEILRSRLTEVGNKEKHTLLEAHNSIFSTKLETEMLRHQVTKERLEYTLEKIEMLKEELSDRKTVFSKSTREKKREITQLRERNEDLEFEINSSKSREKTYLGRINQLQELIDYMSAPKSLQINKNYSFAKNNLTEKIALKVLKMKHLTNFTNKEISQRTKVALKDISTITNFFDIDALKDENYEEEHFAIDGVLKKKIELFKELVKTKENEKKELVVKQILNGVKPIKTRGDFLISDKFYNRCKTIANSRKKFKKQM